MAFLPIIDWQKRKEVNLMLYIKIGVITNERSNSNSKSKGWCR